MSRRSSYRSRSAFDDPGGLDPAYRSGSAFAGFLNQFREDPQEEKAMRRVSKRKRSAGGRGAKRRKVGGPLRLRRPSISARSRSAGGRRRRTFKSRRRTSRSKFVYGNRASKSSLLYRSTLKHILTKPVILRQQATACVNNVGATLQNKCSWLGLFAGWTPSVVDAHIEAQTGVAVNTVLPDMSFFAEKYRTTIQYKNQSNKRCDVTVYRLWPKRDMPAAFGSIVGINPAMLQAGFDAANVAQADGSTRIQDYNEHDADLFQSSNLPSFFRIKRISRKFLEPGAFAVIKFNWRRGRIIQKAKDGVVTTGTYSDTWDIQRWMGGFFLFRVQGSAVHDESKVVVPLVNTDLSPTMSGYNVEFYQNNFSKSLSAYAENSTRVGVLSAKLPTIAAAANEQGWEIQVPQEDQMAA